MPDPHPLTRRNALLLTHAHDLGLLVKVRCMACFGTRFYVPADLQKLFGNLDCESLDRRMRCERCGRNDCMTAETVSPSAAERQNTRIRRLVRIRWKKIPIWREE